MLSLVLTFVSPITVSPISTAAANFGFACQETRTRPNRSVAGDGAHIHLAATAGFQQGHC